MPVLDEAIVIEKAARRRRDRAGTCSLRTADRRGQESLRGGVQGNGLGRFVQGIGEGLEGI